MLGFGQVRILPQATPLQPPRSVSFTPGGFVRPSLSTPGQAFLSPEDLRKLGEARRTGGQAVEAGRKVYGAVPGEWWPYILAFGLGWWARGRR